MQSRRWCFTYHTEDVDKAKLFVSKLRSHKAHRGTAAQLEICPTTSRSHLQGYVEFNTTLRLAALKKLSNSAHWESAKGSREQCVAYCQKQDSRAGGEDPVYSTCDPILSEKATQGKRNDLLECAQLISSGEWDRAQVYDQRPDLVLKFTKGVNELLRYREQSNTKQQRSVTVHVIHGPAGSGKTRYAFGDGRDVFILENSNANAVWWDGYMGESRLIIDDFYGWIPHNQLLRFLDIYPLRLDIKGGTCYAQWDTVYITSNKHPCDWYKKFKWDDDGALQRRIHHIWYAPMGGKWICEKTGEEKQVEF